MKKSKKEKKIEKIYRDRKDRVAHPEGEFDGGGRFYPSETEEQECCAEIRSPSRAYPYSLMVHCRTLKHVKNLVNNS